jgi:hypothetical protein
LTFTSCTVVATCSFSGEHLPMLIVSIFHSFSSLYPSVMCRTAIDDCLCKLLWWLMNWWWNNTF